MSSLKRSLPALMFAVLAGCSDGAEHEVAVPWALGGQWMVADLHSHTQFSDGFLTPEDLVKKALVSGCQALAITDHGDTKLKGATPEYVAEIRRLRQKYPKLALIAGMEWNIPPYRGREHVGTLVDPALEMRVLPEFKRRFERSGQASAQDGLAWLQGQSKNPGDIVLIYNHPSRQAPSPGAILDAFSLWRRATPLMTGFEGGPGHQRGRAGSHPEVARLEHRWDPVASTAGGLWDMLLDRGENVWAALASSDYHNEELDFPPCAFSRTYLQVPERSPAGVLKALRAGTYWAAQGWFLDHLFFTVSAPGLELPASPGEVIRYRRGREIRARVELGRSQEMVEAPLVAELFGNCRSGKPGLLASMPLEPGQSTAEMTVAGLTPGADDRSCYLRLRVRKKGEHGDDRLAYTNPIRIKLD